MGKRLTELIIEGEQSVMDNLGEPYLFLVDRDLDRLEEAINILADEKMGYGAVNQSVDSMSKEVLVLMEKKK